jgi:hypothetical protein
MRTHQTRFLAVVIFENCQSETALPLLHLTYSFFRSGSSVSTMSAQPDTLKQSYNDVVEATSYDVLIDMIKAGYETIAA